MKNLYDLLGARPDDDAEILRKAYRKAAKASHPDHHGGDQDAAARFRQIMEAYNILRDAEQRATYNRFLEFRRKPLRAKLKRAISELKHYILHDAVAAVVLTIVVAGGYTLFVRISQTPVDEAAGTTRDEPEGIVAVQAAQRNGAERDDLDHVVAPPMPIVPGAAASAANDPDALEMTKDAPVPRQARQTIDVARRDDQSGIAIDEPSATAGAGDPGKSQRVHPFDRHETLSADIEFSVPGRHNFAPNASSSAGDKEAAGTTGDAPEGIVAVQAAQRNGAERDNLDRVAAPLMPIVPGAVASAANDPDALEMTKDEAVPRQAWQTIDVARRDDHSGVEIDQSDTLAGAGDPGKGQRVHPFDRNEVQSAAVEFSVPGRHDFAPNASSSGGDKLGNKSSRPGGGKTGDLKAPKIKISARPLPAVKRPASSRPPFKQALLQDRYTSACVGSQSCSGRVPPLFGVGP